MKNLIYLLSFISFISTASGTAIFRCNLPISPFDSSFQQGQELYLDVDLIQEKPIVTFYRSYGAKVVVNQELKIKQFGFSNSHSTFTVFWKNSSSYLSMVYLGAKSWGAYLKYEQPLNGLPVESELNCLEQMDVTKI